ncbi:MAG: phosphomannomutase/phosphoglucomutase [Pseudomonadales bacterium]|jgi:phosphomannomutase/phosphoglucomutase|nr:phosphomannomutase/phosphoglucomutase [Pseudomonadales bacterium]MCP5337304.1 phosphomannomutase/phosphoglucomutase [Pseudomonadales bacterium]
MNHANRPPVGALATARNRILTASTLGLAVLLGALLVWNSSSERLAHAHWIEAQAAQAARAVSAYGALLQAQAQTLAAHGNPDTAQITFPTLESSQFVPLGGLGIADPSFDSGLLRNNIETRLVGRAFNGEAVRAEAYRDGERWIVIAAARLSADRPDARGVLLLRTDLGMAAREHLALHSDAGTFSLWAHGAEDHYRFVAQPGAGDAPPEAPRYLAETDVRPIYAGFDPTSSLPSRAVFAGAIMLSAGLAAMLGLGALVLTAFRRLGSTLGADANRLRDLTLLQRGTTATLPPLDVAELKPLGEALLAVVREQAGGESTAPSLPPGSAEATMPAADPLEILTEFIPHGSAEATPASLPATEVPAEIFRDYDIRGQAALIGSELALAIGRAIGSEALERGCDAIMVGVDGRDSSPRLREQLVKGLLATGIDVIDTGTVATPMLYFACHHLHTPSGVMVTGSHNPADHNGFKIMLDGETLRGDAIAALRERIITGRFREGQGSYRVTGIDSDYIRAIAEDVLIDGARRVVIDCGNGAAAVVAEDLFRELGCDVVPLHCTLDGRFPNHHPDPAEPDNLRDLIAAVKEHGAALGIAFDGDGDRIGVVSASGTVVTADRLLMLFARELLSRHPGADVVFDVKCSRDLPAIVAQNGGRPIMCRSGHSWIKEKMKETGALLGGEFTGHICFRDRWYGFDDALYCAARLLEILSAEGHSLDELLASLPQSVATPELRIPIAENRKFAAMAAVEAGITLEGARISRIDGVRAEFVDGWGLVRASNTSAALILRFEARDEAALERIRAGFRSELSRLLPETSGSF